MLTYHQKYRRKQQLAESRHEEFPTVSQGLILIILAVLSAMCGMAS